MIIPVPVPSKIPMLPIDVIGQIFTYLDINKNYGMISVIRNREARRQIRRIWIACTRFYAVVLPTGKRYYANNTIHRIDGPAIELPDGGYSYVQYGQLHRDSGEPAVCKIDFTHCYEWWCRGVQRSGGDNEWSMTIGGIRFWEKNGLRHRLDGPAVVDSTSEEWYREGKRHRDGDLPACTSDGYLEWFVDGVHHRENGPAVVTPDGESWYYRGEVHREGGPAHITKLYRSWYRHGKYHRDDGPAIEHVDGLLMWYTDGVFVRQEFRDDDITV